MEEKDALSYLLENGVGLSEIQTYGKAGISLEELCAAVESRIQRGVPPTDDPKEKEKDQRPVLTLALLGDFLREAGISEQAIRRVRTPIGTAIKAVTPEEIAVSITGELIHERALRREAAGEAGHSCPSHL